MKIIYKSTILENLGGKNKQYVGSSSYSIIELAYDKLILDPIGN